MVSIILRVDLLGNTVVDWICKLSYFRLDTLTLLWAVHARFQSHTRSLYQTSGSSAMFSSYSIVLPVFSRNMQVPHRCLTIGGRPHNFC